MPRLQDWEPEWTCKCGARWRASEGDWDLITGRSPMSSSRFLSFGFRQLCPKCGGVIGEDGPPDQVRCEVVRYTGNQRIMPFRLLSPSTWFAPRTPIVREVKGKPLMNAKEVRREQ